MASIDVLNASNNAELLSYVINSNPELTGNVDLPVQGSSIEKIGDVIINNKRYRNAFINTINVLALTVVHRNGWDNPWNFTIRGNINYGDSVREIIVDLVDAEDYNEMLASPEDFIKNKIPNVYQIIHELNFQKYYKTSVNNSQIRMAFQNENGLFNLIDTTIGALFESFVYDRYIVDKYQVARRIVTGSVTPHEIEDFDTKTSREILEVIKGKSNDLTFRSPDYNPAGLAIATQFKDQIALISSEFEAKVSTSVLATSFFKDEAEMRSRSALIDGFGTHNTARLSKLLKDSYTEFTDTEIANLKKIPCMIIDREWFQDYVQALDNEMETIDGTMQTEFFNPQTLTRNYFLHAWMVFATSPFKNAIVFTTVTPTVTSVSVTPATATVPKGYDLQLISTVVTTGFANESVKWEIVAGDGAVITETGLLKIPASFAEASIKVKATSIFDDTKSGTATITISA